MSDSDAAYAAALAAIRREIADDEPDLTFSFDEVEFRSLDSLPPEFEQLPALRALSLDNTQVADLEPLRAFSDLQVLRFRNTRVADLAPIRVLTSLRTLSLDDTPVADLAALQGLTSLQELSLARTRIADLAPVRTLTGLRTLSLNDTKFLTDLRPISELTSLVDGGLHYRGCAACALDPDGLGRLAEIEDNRERTERTLAYLRGLTVWPPVRPDPPEQDDLLRVAPNADGRLDVVPVRPGPAEVAETLKRTLYRRLRVAFADLERAAGNYHPDVFRRARAAQERCPEDFAGADLVAVYLEIAWVRAEFDRRSEREGEDRFSNAAVAALNEILTVGPGIVLDNPDVEALEDRRRRFAVDPLPPEAAAAQEALAETITAAVDAFGDTLRAYEVGSLHPTPDPADRRGVLQRLLTWNTVIAVAQTLAADARTGIVGSASVALAVWLVNNQGLVLTAAAGWGEMFLTRLGPVFDQARAILAAGQAAGGVRPPPRLPKLP